MLNRIFVGSLCFVVFFCTGFKSQAQDTPPVPNAALEFSEPVSARSGNQNDFGALLNLSMDEGWHTYWRVPGDAGLPIRFDWSNIKNISEITPHWPLPKRIDENGFTVFGYKNDVFFPVNFTVENPEEVAVIDVQADVLLCNQICIPAQLSASLSFTPSDIEHKEKNLAMWDVVVEQLPHPEDSNLRIENVVLGPDALVMTTWAKNGFNELDIIPVVEDMAQTRALTSAPQITPDPQNTRQVVVKITKPEDIENLAKFLHGKTLEITLISEGEAIVKNFDF